MDDADCYQNMLEAIRRGIRDPKRALGYLELGARVLDTVDQANSAGGPPVTIVIRTNVDFEKMRAAEVRARALPPPDESSPVPVRGRIARQRPADQRRSSNAW